VRRCLQAILIENGSTGCTPSGTATGSSPGRP